jgi:hypothetical protein
VTSNVNRYCGCAPDAFLHLGVQFADGRKATNLDRPDWDPEGPAPDRPVPIQQGGVAAAPPGKWSTGWAGQPRRRAPPPQP